MAHEVETMFSARQVPWHGLGTVTADTLRSGEAIVTAGLDWTVEPEPVFRLSELGAPVEIDSHMAFVRSTDKRTLHIAKPGYTPIQNRAMFDFAETLLDLDDGIQVESAGSLRNGGIVWMTVRLDGPVRVNGDEHVPYMLLSNAHDGTMAFRAAATPIRVVCMNTLRFALRAAKATWAVRHTRSATQRVDEARTSLGLTFKYLEHWQIEVDRLMNTTVSDSRFESILTTLFPTSEAMTDRQADSRERRVMTVRRLYDGPTVGEFRGTGWGAVNAVNEWEAWSTRARSSTLSSDRFRVRQMEQVVRGGFPKTLATVSLVKASGSDPS